MAQFIKGKATPKRRRAAMQAALYHARDNREARHDTQVKNNVKPVASTPNPDVMGGTKGNGQN